MFHSTFSDSLEAALEREIVGQVAIGQYRLLVGSKHGVLLTLAEVPVAAPTLRPTPINHLPRAFPRLIGRQAELEKARSALNAHQALEIYGQPGVGKSAFLQHLLQPQAAIATRGNAEEIVQSHRFYFSQSLTVPEVFQQLFEAFYTTPTGVQRSIHEMERSLHNWQRQSLEDRSAVIVIDSLSLTESEINRIKTVLPNCTLIVASRERRFKTAEVAIGISGLSLQETHELLERELGQVSSQVQELGVALPSEATTIESLWRLLEGNPQRLLQAAALVREDRISLEQTLQYIQTDEPIRTFTRLSLASLPKSQRWIVALLTAMRGIGLRSEQIAAMVGPPNPQSSLQSLLQRHLIQRNHDRYFLADGLADVLQAEFNATPWMERAIAYLIPWAETHQSQPDEILEEHGVLMYGLHWMMEQRRWRDGLRLIAAIEVALILGSQWEAWRQSLRWSLKAAWALGDEQLEAWAMHQLGTLSFCQEHITDAYDMLNEALKIRRANFGNELATTLTRRNLTQIKETLVPPTLGNSTLRLNQRRTYRTLALIGVVVFLISALIGSVIWQRLMGSPSGGDNNAAPLRK